MIAMLAVVLMNAGETSISRVPSIELGAKGLLRFGLDGGVSASTTFPEPGVSRRLTRTAVRAAYTFDGFELFGSVTGATLTGPRQMSAQGDARIGAKWKPAGRAAFWGVDTELLFPSSIDGSFPATDAVSARVRILGGHGIGSFIGLDWRLDGTAGFDMDRTRNIIGDAQVTPTELYGLGIQRGGAVIGGLALSGVQGDWMPYVELSGGYPVLAPTDDAPLLVTARGTAGFRWTFAKGVSVDAAVDIALGSTGANALFRTAPPWEGRAGISIALDPVRSLGEVPPPPPPQVKTVYVEKPAPAPRVVEVQAPSTDALLAGRVVDEEGRPVRGAIVDLGDARTVSGDDGRFQARVEAGRVGIAVKHPDFEPMTLTEQVDGGARREFGVKMRARPATGQVVVRVTGASAPVRMLVDGLDQVFNLSPGEAATFDRIPEGPQRLVFSSVGSLNKARKLEIVAGKACPVEVSLTPRPAVSALDGLDVRRPIGPQDGAVLDELASAILEIEPAFKYRVSGPSADAVVAALVDRGVPASMLEAVVEKGRKTVHVERVP